MAYTTIDDPSLYFQTVLYTGNDADSRAVTLPGDTDMQPDFVWLKDRHTSGSGTSYHHQTFDSVRGASAGALYTSLNNAEDTNYPLSSFDSDGFTLMSSTHDSQNENAEGYVAWCWKAGTSFTNDQSATGIGSIDSTGSVSADAGFSIISYTGGTDPETFAHGLGVVPTMIIVKDRSTSGGWRIYNQAIGNDKILSLGDGEYGGTIAAASSDAWNATTPTSSVVTVGNDTITNGNGTTHIAYCFADVQGYSKFGSYTGNGANNFIYTGFSPAWVMIKKTDDTHDWHIFDNKRDAYNERDSWLEANTANAEATSSNYVVDFLSNGFKTGSGSGLNGSGETFIYMAFAEAPFVTSSGVPACAR